MKRSFFKSCNNGVIFVRLLLYFFANKYFILYTYYLPFKTISALFKSECTCTSSVFPLKREEDMWNTFSLSLSFNKRSYNIYKILFNFKGK